MIGLLVVAQLAMVAHAPDTATTCAPFSITVAARAPGNVAPRIAPPASTPSLQLLKTSTSSRIARLFSRGKSFATRHASLPRTVSLARR